MAIANRTPDEVKECFQLRQAWSRSKRRFAALRRTKIEDNQYRCEKCKEVFKYRDVTVDHIAPVVDVEKGWQGVGEFARRLYCEADGLQVLCIDKCHAEKSKRENKARRKK